MIRQVACTIVALASLTAGEAYSQSSQGTQILPELRERGTYHSATGTWSRAVQPPPAAFGPQVVYSNTGSGGLTLPLPSSQSIVDEGRIPSTTSTNPVGAQDSYFVNGFQIAYCVDSVPTSLTQIDVAFYESYTPCTMPAGPPDALFQFNGTLPGATTPGNLSCWIVTIDLTGDSEFCIRGDGDGAFGGQDHFGWSMRLAHPGGGTAIMVGDPLGSPGTTGLDTEDRYYLIDHTTPSLSTCVVGNYPASAFASFWLQVFADGQGDCTPVGTSYCVATPNSTGFSAVMDASGSNRVSANDLILSAAPVPATQPGLFYYGAMQVQTPFGNGFQCVGGAALGRLPVVQASASGVLAEAVDNTMPPTGQTVITPGSTWNFQAWFRDPAAGGAMFDLSNAYSVTFVM